MCLRLGSVTKPITTGKARIMGVTLLVRSHCPDKPWDGGGKVVLAFFV
jgi:hypothetical protein